MAAGTTAYAEVLGEGRSERDRLLEQAAALEPEATVLLDDIGVKEGWRAIDVGCGPLGILELLSARVGPAGEVVGIDGVGRFVEMADALTRDRGLTNVRVVRADARDHGLPNASFDLVHERLVLIGPDREAIAAAMVGLARPGGFVVAQEVDITSSFCEPAIPECGRLLDAFLGSTHRIGADPGVGRRLGGLLARAGATDVRTEVRARLDGPGSPRRMQLAALAGNAREGILRTGTLGEPELDELLAASRAHHADPATLVFGGLLFQAWGRRPAG